MSLKESIFSYEWKHRLARHTAFWIAICLLKFYSDLYPNDPEDFYKPDIYRQSLSSLVHFIPLYIIAVYSFTGILLPVYLQKKRYAAFILAALAVLLVIFVAGIFLSSLHFNTMGWQMTGQDKIYAPWRTSMYQGVMLAFLGAGGAASSIKLAKTWYLLQTENTKLAKQKADKEIKLLKAQIQPAFLFQSLNILHAKILAGADDAPAMVLQLSELLSFLLYDCNSALIALDQELKMIQVMVDISASDNQSGHALNIFINGDAHGKYISPLLLFSNLQASLDDAETANSHTSIILNITEKELQCNIKGCTKKDMRFNLYASPGDIPYATAAPI